MLDCTGRQATPKDLFIHWLVFAALLVSLAVYAFIGYTFGAPLRAAAAGGEPIVLRSVFYGVSIITFPLIQLIRHISIRLNQTMTTPTPAKTRYLISVLISLALSETIGIYGLVLAMLGDTLNSLWIFTFLATLAMLLYRPKFTEYQNIVEAINDAAQHPPHVR